MQYNSTRNHKQTASPAEAVLRGIAPDGGLYLCDPATLPLDPAEMLQKDFAGMAEAVLVRLLPDYTPEMLRPMIAAAYGKFDTADITPLVMVGDYHVLELFHGPTCAFKDVALSLLPYLITGAKQLLNDKAKTVILTATSGDTGKAALEGFCDVTSTSIVVFYPKDGVSKIQEQQTANSGQEKAGDRRCAADFLQGREGCGDRASEIAEFNVSLYHAAEKRTI